jgi:hypothetical protein
VAPQSPAAFTFRLRNPGDKRGAFRFDVDTYALPNAPACPVRIEKSDRGTFSERLRKTRAVHGLGHFPVPADWSVEIAPDAPELNPGEEAEIAVKITPPAGFTGAKPFNVNARLGGKYAGGVTLVVSTL